MTAILLALLAGGGVALLLYGFTLGEGADTISNRLYQFGRIGELPPSIREVELAASPRDRLLKPLVARLSRLAGNLHGRSALERMEKQILQSGNTNTMTVEDLLGYKGLSALAVGLFAMGFAYLLLHAGAGVFIVVTLAGACLGYLLPSLAIKQKTKKRQKAIIKVLPDAVDMLSISVEAGLGFDAAMTRLSSKMKNELTMEFDRASAEIRLGKARREALKNLVERTGVDDLSAFINALVQADHLGVAIASVLKTQAQVMRVKRRQRAEEKARKAPVKMMFPLVGLLFPPLLIVIMGPIIPTLIHGARP